MTVEEPEDANVAVRVLTDAQLVRWVLRHAKGWSIDRIARLQGVSKAAVRESLEASSRAITKAKEDGRCTSTD